MVGVIFFLGFDVHIWLSGGWYLSRLLGLYLLFHPTMLTLIATSFKLADAGAHPIGVAHARWLPQLASSHVAAFALAAALMTDTPSLYFAAAILGSREVLLRLGLLGNVVRLRINSSKHGFMVMPELVVNAQVGGRPRIEQKAATLSRTVLSALSCHLLSVRAPSVRTPSLPRRC